MPEFRWGFLAWTQAHPGVAGDPLENEWTERGHVFLHNRVNRQDCSRGTLRYYEESDRITFTPIPAIPPPTLPESLSLIVSPPTPKE